jgi:hypothetical protein
MISEMKWFGGTEAYYFPQRDPSSRALDRTTVLTVLERARRIGNNTLRCRTTFFVSSCFWSLDCRILGLIIGHHTGVYSRYASIENEQAGFYQPRCRHLELF